MSQSSWIVRARPMDEYRRARNRLAKYTAWALLGAAIAFTLFAPSIAATIADPLAGMPY